MYNVDSMHELTAALNFNQSIKNILWPRITYFINSHKEPSHLIIKDNVISLEWGQIVMSEFLERHSKPSAPGHQLINERYDESKGLPKW